MRGSGHRLKSRKFHLNVSKHILVLRVIKHPSRLPMEIMMSPSLEILKTQPAMLLDSLL